MHNHEFLDGHKVSVNLLEKGVYAKETHHSTVRLAPALTISENQINLLLSAVRDVIKDIKWLILNYNFIKLSMYYN